VLPGRCLPAPLRELVKVALLAGLVALFLGLVFKDRWPGREDFRPEVFQEPVQDNKGVPEPFDVIQKGYTYTVRPVFGYEIWGMVASSHYAGSFLDIAHEMWKDYLNIKDLCLLWGENLETDAFRRLKFWNRDFTCFYSWSDAASGQAFSGSHISNNHLITPDGNLRRIIRSSRRGDQVHVCGWLASYGHKGSSAVRGTSTTRNDSGNGACETIYVTRFEIIKRANAGWRSVIPVSLGAVGSCLVLLFLF
jgi:hypothetical protein